MCLKSQGVPPLPEDTARVARRAFPKGNIYLTIGDKIGVLFEDADFADMYANEGKPAVPPYLLAMVCIFQFMEDLSDREAADAVRARIDWKYALHLPLDDGGRGCCAPWGRMDMCCWTGFSKRIPRKRHIGMAWLSSSLDGDL